MLLILQFLAISRWQLAQLASLSLVAGIANTGLIYLIGKSSTASSLPWPIAVSAFAAIWLVFFASQRLLLKTLVRQSERGLRDVRLDLLRRLLLVEYATFESVGRAKVLAALTHDANHLSFFWPLFVSLCVSSITIFSSLGYLAYLSPYGFALTGTTIAIGVAIYAMLTQHARRQLNTARGRHNVFLRQVDDLLGGIKELKLNRKRRHEIFVEQLSDTCETYFQEVSGAKIAHNNAGLIGNSIFIVLIGFVAYAVPMLAPTDAPAHFAFLVALLYLVDPLSRIVANLPAISNAYVSARHIHELRERLQSAGESSCTLEHETTLPAFHDSWRELHLVDIHYRYTTASETGGFSLGPLSLTIRRGELVFLVGGNGTGKSTFGRLLTGLYKPDSGYLSLDDTRVTPINTDAYRQLFAAIYSDYHLFQYPRHIPAETCARLAPLLREFALDPDMLSDEGLARVTTLSQGKQKRMALVLAYLEDKPIYFLDEWAADQDPAFRSYFYLTILPRMKQLGKTLIVATHDDRFFHLADRVLYLDAGKFRQPENPMTSPAVALVSIPNEERETSATAVVQNPR